MSTIIFHVIAWQTLGCALLVWGFAPGALLRLIVLLYARDDPRRRELIDELYNVPRIDRPFWVAQQFETALFEGVGGRLAARRARRLVSALFYVNYPGGAMALRLSLTRKLHCPDVPEAQLWRGISRRSRFAAKLDLDMASRELQRMNCGRWPEDLPEGSYWAWLQWLEPYPPLSS